MAQSRLDREADDATAWTGSRTGQKKLSDYANHGRLAGCEEHLQRKRSLKRFLFLQGYERDKRHLAVDTLGFPFFTLCTPANVSDDMGLLMMLILNIEYFKAKPVNIPKITLLLDNGYHLEKLTKTLEAVYPGILRKVRFELSPKPSKAEKAAQGKTGFVPIPVRWVIERSNAWMERCKSLTKNFERTLVNAKAQMDFCFVRLMLKRLAAKF